MKKTLQLFLILITLQVQAQITSNPAAFEVDQQVTITVDINSTDSDCNGISNPGSVYMHSGIGDNTNAFGLPVIEVHPFSRNATSTTSTSSINTAMTATATAAATVATATAAKVNEVKSPKVETPVLETPTKMKEEDKKATIPLGDKPKRGILYWVQKTLPFLLIASLIFMAASYFMMRKGGDSKLAKASIAQYRRCIV